MNHLAYNGSMAQELYSSLKVRSTIFLKWQAPVLLGLVKPGETDRVPLQSLPPLEANQLFELTLEKSANSPTGLPTGPVKFIDRAVKVI